MKKVYSLKDFDLEMELCVGVIAKELDGMYVEWFLRAEKEEDLPPMESLKLRARFNSHRQYILFYFKVPVGSGQFEELHEQFLTDNETFAKSIDGMHSVTFDRL